MRTRGTVSTLRAFAATALASLGAAAQDAVPAVQSIDIYGSSVLDSTAARAEFGTDLLRYVELGWQAGLGGSVPQNAAELEARMLAIDAKIRTARSASDAVPPRADAAARRSRRHARVIAALDFPSSADRNKAAHTVAALAGDPRYHDTIRAEAVPAALRLLKLEKANNHEPAYEILKQVSGESFGDRDYAVWERWAASR